MTLYLDGTDEANDNFYINFGVQYADSNGYMVNYSRFLPSPSTSAGNGNTGGGKIAIHNSTPQIRLHGRRRRRDRTVEHLPIGTLQRKEPNHSGDISRYSANRWQVSHPQR